MANFETARNRELKKILMIVSKNTQFWKNVQFSKWFKMAIFFSNCFQKWHYING